MNIPQSEDFYLNRRAVPRIEFRSKVRFVEDPTRHLFLAQGLSQNLSLTGMQILSSTIPEPKKSFELWIPVGHKTFLPAVAKAAWISVEDTFGDSPYWVRTGISLRLKHPGDRDLLFGYITKKLGGIVRPNDITDPKVGYVF